MTVSLYSCVCHFFSDALNWYHQAFLLLYTLSYGLIQNFQNNEEQPDSKERYWVVLCAVPLFTILYKMVLTLTWKHLFSTTLLNYIGISLVFSVRNTSLASKRIIQTWLSNSHGCDVIHVCRQLNAATIIECKSREWCVAFLLAWYDT